MNYLLSVMRKHIRLLINLSLAGMIGILEPASLRPWMLGTTRMIAGEFKSWRIDTLTYWWIWMLVLSRCLCPWTLMVMET